MAFALITCWKAQGDMAWLISYKWSNYTNDVINHYRTSVEVLKYGT